jgi:hypothetical protein
VIILCLSGDPENQQSIEKHHFFISGRRGASGKNRQPGPEAIT